MLISRSERVPPAQGEDSVGVHKAQEVFCGLLCMRLTLTEKISSFYWSLIDSHGVTEVLNQCEQCPPLSDKFMVSSVPPGSSWVTPLSGNTGEENECVLLTT